MHEDSMLALRSKLERKYLTACGIFQSALALCCHHAFSTASSSSFSSTAVNNCLNSLSKATVFGSVGFSYFYWRNNRTMVTLVSLFNMCTSVVYLKYLLETVLQAESRASLEDVLIVFVLFWFLVSQSIYGIWYKKT